MYLRRILSVRTNHLTKFITPQRCESNRFRLFVYLNIQKVYNDSDEYFRIQKEKNVPKLRVCKVFLIKLIVTYVEKYSNVKITFQNICEFIVMFVALNAKNVKKHLYVNNILQRI